MKLHQPPYYAVIFTAREGKDLTGYEEWDKQMFELAQQQPGYLGHESYGSESGGVTISYWKDEEAIAHWKNNKLHKQAQELGKLKWYEQYRIRVCKVEKDYGKD